MKNKKICIVGLGYVGLPLLCLIAKKNYLAFGYDIDLNRIKKLKKSKSYISDINDKQLKILHKKNLFSKNNLQKLNKMDYIIICLPTPLTKAGSPDLSYIKNFFNASFKYFRKGQTIILESTVPPMATENIFLKKLNKKFTVGKDFYLCFSPERINPGNSTYNLENITKIISGFSINCIISIKKLYSTIFKKIFVAKNIKVAEFAKIYENTFRSVNISLANEMKIFTNKLGINIFDVIKASSTKEFGFTPFYPGPGVGGHCIPIDPFFLKSIGRQLNTTTEFISLANKINKKITKWIIQKINKNISNESKLLLIGISYKKNINDLRMSPALIFFNYFLNKIKKIDFYDPYIKKVKIKNKTIYSLKNIKKNILRKYDGVVIISDHDCLSYKFIQENSKLVYDTRGRYNDKICKNVILC